MRLGSFKNVISAMFTNPIYLISMSKEWLIFHKTKLNQTDKKNLNISLLHSNEFWAIKPG